MFWSADHPSEFGATSRGDRKSYISYSLFIYWCKSVPVLSILCLFTHKNELLKRTDLRRCVKVTETLFINLFLVPGSKRTSKDNRQKKIKSWTDIDLCNYWMTERMIKLWRRSITRRVYNTFLFLCFLSSWP